MAKIPKIGDLASNMPGVLGKFKSMLDSLGGPSTAQATQEAIDKETDPRKAKLLELQFLINQLYDVQLIQAKTIHELKNKYGEIEKLFSEMEHEILEHKKPEGTPAQTEQAPSQTTQQTAPQPTEPEAKTPEATPQAEKPEEPK